MKGCSLYQITGTSLEFWRLVCAQRYDEARRLLLDRLVLKDPEAAWEAHLLYAKGTCGFPRNDSMADMLWNVARDADHPRTLFDARASGYKLAIWEMHAVSGEPPDQLLREAYAQEPLPEVLFLMGKHREAADLGYPEACSEYATELLDAELSSRALPYVLRAAAFGDIDACYCYCYMFKDEPLLVDWILLAHYATSKLDANSCVIMLEAWELGSLGHRHPREKYAWGAGFARYSINTAEHSLNVRGIVQSMVKFATNVSQKVRASSVAFLGAMRHKRVGKDVALLIARMIWQSRRTHTEVWSPAGKAESLWTCIVS